MTTSSHSQRPVARRLVATLVILATLAAVASAIAPTVRRWIESAGSAAAFGDPGLDPVPPEAGAAQPWADGDVDGRTGADWVVAPGGTAEVGSGTLYRYRVEVEHSTGLDAVQVASFVDHVLGHPRGWTNEPVAFQRVDTGPAEMVIRLAQPSTVDELCAPLQTNGEVSCTNGDLVVLNLARWNNAVPAYANDIDGYRTLLVNHEVGHRIGHAGHPPCPGPGLPQPVMMQVFYTGLQGCSRNIWPYAADGGYLG